MNTMRVELHKGFNQNEESVLFSKIIITAGVSVGAEGAFFKQGLYATLINLMNAEDYVLRTFDQHLYKLGWGEFGLLSSLELDESDFINGEPDQEKLVNKMIESLKTSSKDCK